MWPFRRKDTDIVEPDPVANPISWLCYSLARKPWEWSPKETSGGDPVIRHISGMTVSYRVHGGDHYAWFAPAGANVAVPLHPRESLAIVRAIFGGAASLGRSRKIRFDDTAVALAASVQDGNLEAARALADRIIEFCNDNGGIT
jgi:hypothetical protein